MPSKTRLAEVLAEAVAQGVDMTAPRVVAQSDVWFSGDGDCADSYALNAAIAWRRVLAGYECATLDAGESWGRLQRTYLELLVERVKGFRPTRWGRSNMHTA